MSIEYYRQEYAKYSILLPHELEAIIKRGIIREYSDSFSAIYPWTLCGRTELEPLSMRWPSVKCASDYIPFARRFDSDDLACFEYPKGSSSKIVQIHYEIGNFPSYRIEAAYDNPWEWLHSALDDVADFIEAQRDVL